MKPKPSDRAKHAAEIRKPGPMGPVWKPCFVCKEKVQVRNIENYDDGPGLMPVCGHCRRRAAETEVGCYARSGYDSVIVGAVPPRTLK